MTGQEDRYTPGEDASAETEYSLQVVMDTHNTSQGFLQILKKQLYVEHHEHHVI